MWCWVPTTSVGGRPGLEYSWARGAPVLASLATATTHSLLLEITGRWQIKYGLFLSSKFFPYSSLRDTEEEKEPSFRLSQGRFDSLQGRSTSLRIFRDAMEYSGAISDHVIIK